LAARGMPPDDIWI